MLKTPSAKQEREEGIILHDIIKLSLCLLLLRSPRQSRLLISERESTMNAFRRIKP